MASKADHAREAIENVCAGDLSRLDEFYAADFHDHVNRMEFHGHDGVRRSVALYRRLFSDLRFEVEQQVADGELVASRWTLQGTNRGRAVKLGGITISRVVDGKIVEDWGFTDSVELVRQLGVWRSLLTVFAEWRLLLSHARGDGDIR